MIRWARIALPLVIALLIVLNGIGGGAGAPAIVDLSVIAAAIALALYSAFSSRSQRDGRDEGSSVMSPMPIKARLMFAGAIIATAAALLIMRASVTVAGLIMLGVLAVPPLVHHLKDGSRDGR